jgi:putative membrane protein
MRLPCFALALALLAAPAAAADAEMASFFVIDAIKGDNGEIAVGSLVEQQAASKEVRDLGAMMVRDHGATRDAAIAAGKAVGVGVPTAMTPQAQHLLRKLARLSGPEFDKTFLTATIKDHRKAIDKFAKQGRGGDPVTSKLADDALPKMREHLRIALSLR